MSRLAADTQRQRGIMSRRSLQAARLVSAADSTVARRGKAVRRAGARGGSATFSRTRTARGITKSSRRRAQSHPKPALPGESDRRAAVDELR